MNVYLLYRDREWVNTRRYYDIDSIIKDLGVDVLVDSANKGDTLVCQTMKRVMMVPIDNEADLKYRHDILYDLLLHEGFTKDVYMMTAKVLKEWEKLGKNKNEVVVTESKASLISDINILRVLVMGMTELKKIFAANADVMTSEGLKQLNERVQTEFSDDLETVMYKIIDDLAFYSNPTKVDSLEDTYRTNMPVVTVDCGIAEGLKLCDVKLENLESELKTVKRPNSLKMKISGFFKVFDSKNIPLYGETAMQEDAAVLTYRAVSYVMACCSDTYHSIGRFFENLNMQMAFYYGAVNIKHLMQKYRIEYCIPEFVGQNCLEYENLKEVVMKIKQSGEVIGNSGELNNKSLVIITGANQGGKSTFLRSLGIAQIMMQAGLFVPAKKYRSGLYPNFFTHFTRREDSAMNSGRLDEEMRRMDGIVNHLGENSLILLNESFASTTELEGSNIAYDIIKALNEQNIKIISVTHLLSFAKRVYNEARDTGRADIAFLSAERLEDGTRTFKMIAHEPELTSFGLELYDQIIGNKDSEKQNQ